MRRFVLGTIELFGRYTAVLIFALACAAGVVWLSFLDAHPKTVIALAIVVIPVFTASVALLIGLLFSGLAQAGGERLTREEAPELWRIWDELDGQQSSTRQLMTDGVLNASIGERRKIMGLWGQEVTMTVGLPMMLCLDVPALTAVVAHEVGHNELKHTSGLANLVEFERTLETLFEYADPDETITGAAAYFLLGGLGNWLKEEELRLSRQHEFEADQISASRQGADGEARSTVMVEASVAFFMEEIVEPTHKALSGATKAPRPPIDQLVGRLEELRAPGGMARYAQRCWEKAPDPGSTHPSLKERVQAHGIMELPDVGPVGPAAADVLLSPETKARLIKTFDDEWIKLVDQHVRLE